MGPKSQNEMWEEDLESSILGNVGNEESEDEEGNDGAAEEDEDE